MTDEQLIALMTAVEAVFPVDEWTVDGLHVWPIVRYYLYTSNFYMYRQVDAASAPASVPSKLRSLYDGNRSWCETVVRDRTQNAWLEPTDLLFVSDGVSFSFLDGKWVEKWCDPFADEAEALGLKTLLMTPAHGYRTPRSRRSVFYQPALDAVQIACKLTYRMQRGTPRLYRYEEAREFMIANAPSGTDLLVPSAKQLLKEAHYCLLFRRFYERVLERTRPRAVFTVSYYGTERMALLWACKRAGIPTADIQHGYAGRQHFAYGQWTCVPKDGYELLPSNFLVWGDLNFKDIDEWTHGTTAHRPVISGHRFLETWRRGQIPRAKEDDQAVRDLKARSKAARHVLLTLNGLEPRELLEQIAVIVTRTPGTFWWLRTHPVRPQQADVVEEVLRAAGATNAFVREASSIPLFTILNHMDAHVTEISTTCFDAAMFGVPSVLLSNQNAALFDSLVRAGWVRIAESPDGVPTLLDEAMRARATSTPVNIVADMPPLARVLRDMNVDLRGLPIA